MKPTLSIVIPVRNANLYARDAIQSCMGSNMEHIEIIVSDNWSDPGLEDSLGEELKKHPSIKFLKPPTPLSMSQHFNFAVKHVSHDWFTVIGADDGMCPDYFSKFISIVERCENCNILITTPSYYYWPGVEKIYGNRAAKYTYRKMKPVIRDSQYEFWKSTIGLTSPFGLPNGYTGTLLNSRTLQDLRSKDQELFGGASPDVHSSCTLLANFKNYKEFSESISWVGTSRASTGYSSTESVDSSGASDVSLRISDFEFLNKNQKTQFNPLSVFSGDMPLSHLWLNATLDNSSKFSKLTARILKSKVYLTYAYALSLSRVYATPNSTFDTLTNQAKAIGINLKSIKVFRFIIKSGINPLARIIQKWNRHKHKGDKIFNFERNHISDYPNLVSINEALNNQLKLF